MIFKKAKLSSAENNEFERESTRDEVHCSVLIVTLFSQFLFLLVLNLRFEPTA